MMNQPIPSTKTKDENHPSAPVAKQKKYFLPMMIISYISGIATIAVVIFSLNIFSFEHKKVYLRDSNGDLIETGWVPEIIDRAIDTYPEDRDKVSAQNKGEEIEISPQQLIGTFDQILVPNNDKYFVGQKFLYEDIEGRGVSGTEDFEPAAIISKITGSTTTIPGAVGFGFSAGSGVKSPIVSPSKNYLAYQNQDDRTIVVTDTNENLIILPSLVFADTESDLDTYINSWSPNETRLLFHVGVRPIGCMGNVPEDECPKPKGMPEDIPLGYYVADFEAGNVIHLPSLRREYSAVGWLNDHVLLLEREDALYEYDLENSPLTKSSKFTEKDQRKIYHFWFYGTGINDSLVYSYGTSRNSGSPMQLAVRQGSSETIVTNHGWADMDYVRLSDDGRYIYWKFDDNDEEQMFDLESL